jgi:hypothetical protein
MYNPEDKTAGKSDLRKYWNSDFAVLNTTDHWIVTIRNKKVKDVIKATGLSLGKVDFIVDMDFLIIFNESLHIAKDEYKLKPGEGWAISYHFR